MKKQNNFIKDKKTVEKPEEDGIFWITEDKGEDRKENYNNSIIECC